MNGTRLLATLLGLLTLTADIRAQPIMSEASDGRGLYGQVNYLHWWLSDHSLAFPLLTAPAANNPAGDGRLGQSGTQELLAGRIQGSGLDGARITAGALLNAEFGFRVEGSFFALDQCGTERSFGDPTGLVRLAVPFINAEDDTSAVYGLSGAQSRGEACLSVRSMLLGADLVGLLALAQVESVFVDVLGGFRYLHLAEDLAFRTRREDFTGVGRRVFLTLDEFNTRNHFYGPQGGIRLSWCHHEWFAELTGKLALGLIHQDTQIVGLTATNAFPGTGRRTFFGGIYAQQTNIGNNSTDRIALVPEMQLTIGCQITSWLRGSIGYGFLYIDTVARPGNQIDPVINPVQSVVLSNTPMPPTVGDGPFRPAETRGETDFWAHGFNIGLEFQY